MKQKIGFFGGCFNPPSKIHISLAEKLIAEHKVDKVIFVPVGDYYDKKELVNAKHRYNMLKLATKNNQNIEVDDIELNIHKKLYAVDVFGLIECQYKDSDNYLIMGSDNYKNMPTWKNYNQIINKYKYIILERKEEISSSKIRQMIKENIDTSEILEKDVLKYIKDYELYQ